MWEPGAWVREKLAVEIAAGLIVALLVWAIVAIMQRWPYWPYVAFGTATLVVTLIFGILLFPIAHAQVQANLGVATPFETLPPNPTPTAHPPVYIASAKIVGRIADGKHLLAAQMILLNESDEGEAQFFAAEALGKTAADESMRAANIAHVKKLAAETPLGLPKFTLNRKGTSTVAQTAELEVSGVDYKAYMAGQRTFYFAGALVVAINGKTWTLPLCAFSPGDPNVVLQCPK